MTLSRRSFLATTLAAGAAFSAPRAFAQGRGLTTAFA